MTRLLFAACLCALISSCGMMPAIAKHDRVKPGHPAIVTCDQRGCSDWGVASAKPIPSRQSRQEKREARRIARGEAIAKAVGFGAVVERPARRPARLDRGASAAVGLGRRPSAWCGWWMRQHLGVANVAGNLARWWAGFGSRAGGPEVGAVVVWRHHVGIITGQASNGMWIVKSGNDGRAVRERPRSVAGAIAFRRV